MADPSRDRRKSGTLPDAHWGDAEAPLPDWRTEPDDDADPDDELLPETPDDVIAVLGFDPLDEDKDDDRDRKARD